MKISLIAAVDAAGGIGKDGDIPWKIPADMKHFKTVTMGCPVIMGRKTYESIGRPLPGRPNLVLSVRETLSNHIKLPALGEMLYKASFMETITDLKSEGVEQVFIIGGARVYQLAMPMVDEMWITHVGGDYGCDVKFPVELVQNEIKAGQWTDVILAEGETDEKVSYTMRHYTRKI